MSDRRPIENFRFGFEWEPKLVEIMKKHPWPDSAFVAKDGASEVDIDLAEKEWRKRMENLPTEAAVKAWEQTHEKSMRKLKKLFSICGINTRDDIEKLGCTGAASFGVDHIDIKFFRLALAGSGVGLPCYVPETRYCLVHEVSGGLQKGQQQQYIDFVDKVARELTPEEIAHDKLVSAARKSEKEHGAHSLLHGHTLPRGWEEAEEVDGVEGGAQMESIPEIAEKIRAEGGFSPVLIGSGEEAAPWKCGEHDKTDWACRYCVAQSVVEGALVPDYVVSVIGGEASAPPGPSHLAGGDVDGFVEQMEESRMSRVIVYACVATFTRRLSRD